MNKIKLQLFTSKERNKKSELNNIFNFLLKIDYSIEYRLTQQTKEMLEIVWKIGNYKKEQSIFSFATFP